MKDVLYCFFVYLMDFLKMWMVLWGIMNFKLTRNYKEYILVTVPQVIFIFISAFYYEKNPDISANIWSIMVIIFTGLYFEGKFIKKLIYSLLAYSLIVFLDACLMFGASLFTDQAGLEFLNESISIYIYSGFNIITLLIIVIIKKFRPHSKTPIHISKRIIMLLFAGALTGVMILAALVAQSNDNMPLNGKRLVVLVTIIAIVAYNITCIMMIVITESRDNYRTISIVSQNIIESQQQYYSLVNEKQQEMRSIRHEMRNHLSCIYGLSQSKKADEMEQYLKELIDTSYNSETLFDTGNDIVNAILNDAQSRCKSDNIILRLQGGFPHSLHISAMDLCAIFANVISNAVEAIQRMDRSLETSEFVDIQIRSFKEDLYIDVVNPIGNNSVNVKNLTTSKSNKEAHGYGVKNMMRSVDKYQGSVNYKIKDQKMILEIELKNVPEGIKRKLKVI